MEYFVKGGQGSGRRPSFGRRASEIKAKPGKVSYRYDEDDSAPQDSKDALVSAEKMARKQRIKKLTGAFARSEDFVKGGPGSGRKKGISQNKQASHPRFNKEDYEKLKSKGYSDKDIRAIWDRDEKQKRPSYGSEKYSKSFDLNKGGPGSGRRKEGGLKRPPRKGGIYNFKNAKVKYVEPEGYVNSKTPKHWVQLVSGSHQDYQIGDEFTVRAKHLSKGGIGSGRRGSYQNRSKTEEKEKKVKERLKKERQKMREQGYMRYHKSEKLVGGLADGAEDGEFDKEQLKLGIKIEREHTKDRKKAKEIAKDHLKEIPDYYTRLQRMEKEAHANKSMGEGSRGGKVIGRTKSGKPIYESSSGSHAKELHSDYSKKDHDEARKFLASRADEHAVAKRGYDLAGAKDSSAHSKHDYWNKQASNHIMAKFDAKKSYATKDLNKLKKEHNRLKYGRSNAPRGDEDEYKEKLEETKQAVQQEEPDFERGERDMDIKKSLGLKEVPQSLIKKVEGTDESVVKSLKEGCLNSGRLNSDPNSNFLQSCFVKAENLSKGEGVDKYVREILSDKKQVQDVLKEAPESMRDDILAALRERDKGVENKEEKKEEINKKSMVEQALDNIKKGCAEDVDKDKMKRCVTKVKKESPDVDPYAVCHSSVGKKSVQEALDMIKGFGEENLKNTHGENWHSDADRQVVNYLTTVEKVNPFEESHNQSPNKVDPSKPGYTQDKTFMHVVH